MAASLKLVEDKKVDADRQKALDAALAQIDRAFGKGSAMKLGQKEAMQVEAISTGSLGLDIALGVGGLPKGRVIEVYGPESSGKTTLALHVIAEPLPNARSICASAASNAFWRSASTFLSSTSFRLAAMTLPPALDQSRYRLFNWGVMYRLCSQRTRGERKLFSAFVPGRRHKWFAPYFRCSLSTSATLALICCTLNGLGMKCMFSMSISLRSCSSA